MKADALQSSPKTTGVAAWEASQPFPEDPITGISRIQAFVPHPGQLWEVYPSYTTYSAPVPTLQILLHSRQGPRTKTGRNISQTSDSFLDDYGFQMIEYRSSDGQTPRGGQAASGRKHASVLEHPTRVQGTGKRKAT